MPLTEAISPAVGVDGCRAGWIAACARADGRVELRLYRAFAALVADCEAAALRPVVAVDVPIGLPDRAGLRECDREARRRLGRRWMCVFPAPDRALFGSSGRPGVTRQTMGIVPKIAEVDAVLRAAPDRAEWIVEAHPELSFVTLAAALGRPVPAAGLPPKRRPAGREARLALLRQAFPDLEAAGPWPRSAVAPDDVLDAYAALWTARRFPAAAIVLGGDRDAHGLPCRMVA